MDADTADNGTLIQEPYIIDGIFWTMEQAT
jgi:hypothetical protein